MRVAFEEYDGNISDLVGYKKLDIHMIFDEKWVRIFDGRLVWLLAGIKLIPQPLLHTRLLSHATAYASRLLLPL